MTNFIYRLIARLITALNTLMMLLQAILKSYFSVHTVSQTTVQERSWIHSIYKAPLLANQVKISKGKPSAIA